MTENNTTAGDGDGNEGKNEDPNNTGKANGTRETVMFQGQGDVNDHDSPFRGRDQVQHIRSHSRSPPPPAYYW